LSGVWDWCFNTEEHGGSQRSWLVLFLVMEIDRTAKLRELMQRSNIGNFRQLYQLTGTSASTINRLRASQAATLRWQTLINISQGLQISIDELLETFGDSLYRSERQQIAAIQQEYQYLQQQLEHQRENLQAEFQSQSLQILESFLTYFPTAKQAAINNPDFPASKLVPLTKSIEQLISSWGVTVIGAVGTEIVYDPQWHQLIEGAVNPGEIAIVRYVGYRQGDKAIFRAKVSQGDLKS
jgi:transcriptional regulator with XRE-family HTH domain